MRTDTFISSRWRRIVCSLLLVAGAIAAVGASASSRSVSEDGFRVSGAHKIAPWVLEHTDNGKKAEFFVVLVDRFNPSQALSLPTKVEKGHYVYNPLALLW